MSIDDLLSEKVKAAVREVLEERLRPIEEQLARLTPGPAAAQSDDDELSLRRIKDQYGYAAATVRRWIAEDELPAKKGPKEWRVRRGDLKVKIGESSGLSSVVDIRSKVQKMLAGGRR